MRRLRFLAPVFACLLVLVACAPSGATPTPTPSPDKTVVPSPLPVGINGPPVDETRVIIGVDGLALGDASVGYNDGDEVTELLAEALGETPKGEPDPTGYPSTTYEWPGITLYVGDNGATTLLLDEGMANPAGFATVEGITLGATVEQLLAAGAVDPKMDGNSDGVNDTYLLDVEEVPGTVPYADPDGVGTKYIMVTVEDGVAVAMRAPANDYSDA